jgi:hypothetical protein
MKLSQIVNTRYQLGSYDPIKSRQEALLGFEKYLKSAESGVGSDTLLALNNAFDSISNSIENYTQIYDEHLDYLDSEIELQEAEYFANSRQLYDDMQHETNEYILSRQAQFNKETSNWINTRIESYGDWHHAGLIFRPMQGQMLSSLVRMDPLYLVDQHAELLEPVFETARKEHSLQYVNRLNDYVINERDGHGFLDKLPQNQFGYMLAYNFFNYKPLEVIISYLEGAWELLRPGGKIAFTINDCDRPGAVVLAENFFSMYTPGSYIEDYALEKGYNIVEWKELDSANTWVELTKAGTLESIRGGQSLTMIHKSH